MDSFPLGKTCPKIHSRWKEIVLFLLTLCCKIFVYKSHFLCAGCMILVITVMLSGQMSQITALIVPSLLPKNYGTFDKVFPFHRPPISHSLWHFELWKFLIL